MNIERQTSRPGAGTPGAWRAAIACLLLVLSATVLLGACGGGVGSGGTGTYAAGSITGFGSIIVNDVRYDDSTATILDDDDARRSNAELKLGMTVEIDAAAITSDSSGRSSKASSIRFGSELLGPVEQVDVAAGRLTVLGLNVAAATETVFDDRLVGGLAGLRSGSLVEVYAMYDAANSRYRATRIEPRSTAAAWRVRGPVAALDRVARTLRLGTANFAWGADIATPADLGVGRLVRLQLATTLDTSGRYVVTGFGTALRPAPDREEAELEGLVTAFTSAASFQVNGLPIDARAASFPDGTASLRLGARVEVKGRVEAGTLIAARVSIETDSQIEERGFEFKGPIQAVDPVGRTISVRGAVIGTARSDLRLDGGTLADLVVGRAVEVRAQPDATRTRLEATRIVFK